MQFELNQDFLETLENAVADNESNFIKEQLDKLDTSDIALILNHINVDDAKYLYDLLDEKLAADVLLEMDEGKREKLLATFTTKEIAEQIDNMESDDAADMIHALPDEMQSEVLSQIENIDQASDIAELLNYEEGTAGSIMATELVSIHVNVTVSGCIEEIRKQTDNVNNMYAVYVVDEKERLLGMLSLKKLIISHPLTKVSEILDPEIVSVKTTDSTESVATIIQKYDLVVIPVVDQLNRLVGRITVDDVVDVIKELAEKDFQRMSGLTDDVDSNDSVWKLSKARIPWLLVGMCGGIVGSRIISVFQDQIHIKPETAFFIPLITATGGNVGVQSSSIIVQGLANKTLITYNLFPKLLKELSVGLFNGLMCSVLIFGYNALISSSYQLALTVSVSLFTVIVCASFLGTFVPLMMHRFKINPALATGPFVTTLNDIIGISIYFFMIHFLYRFI